MLYEYIFLKTLLAMFQYIFGLTDLYISFSSAQTKERGAGIEMMRLNCVVPAIIVELCFVTCEDQIQL